MIGLKGVQNGVLRSALFKTPCPLDYLSGPILIILLNAKTKTLISYHKIILIKYKNNPNIVVRYPMYIIIMLLSCQGFESVCVPMVSFPAERN